MAAIIARPISNQKNANSTNTEITLYLCQNGKLERLSPIKYWRGW